MRTGQKVYVSGRINYRGIWCSIDSYGTIEDVGLDSCLVYLTSILKEEYRVVTVRNKFITEIKVA